MRAFIAVEIKSDKLKELQKQFDVNGVKLTAHFHITLKFFKEISEENVEKVKTALKTIKFKPFDLELTTLGVFPKFESFAAGATIKLSDGNYVRVIWVGAKSEGLIKLHKEIEEKLKKIEERFIEEEFKVLFSGQKQFLLFFIQLSGYPVQH